jgi:hypothetical protein
MSRLASARDTDGAATKAPRRPLDSIAADVEAARVTTGKTSLRHGIDARRLRERKPNATRLKTSRTETVTKGSALYWTIGNGSAGILPASYCGHLAHSFTVMSNIC